MGYQALLFCPDEKTARTVTQVLNELEFSVEACIEPFAAVKKLMGEHFDAVVVDCDNEQNATLLFKSARNSTSNQTSLAVAVVEGQAGVAKAFRIGANLVLTKPINIEQAKGTLRVARGLLRKGDPAKPGAPAAQAAAPAPAPPKPAPKPVSAAKPVAPVPQPTPAAREIPVPKPASTPAWPAAAAASATHAAKPNDLPEKPVAKAAPTAAVPSTPEPSVPKMEAASFAKAPEAPAASHSSHTSAFSSAGAASAAAPAREPQVSKAPEVPTASAVEIPQAGASPAFQSTATVGAAPTFSFGGAIEPATSGGNKKIFIGVAAAVVIAIAAYFGFASKSHNAGTATTPASTMQSAPANSQAAKAQPTAPGATPVESVAVSTPSNAGADDSESASREPISKSGVNAAKPSANSAPAKATTKEKATKEEAPEEADATPEAAPLMVKGGKAPEKAKSTNADDSAPSMIGMATPASAPPPDLVPTTTTEFKPKLQTMNVSQGVSQGLLYKKVAPVYPSAALRLRIEGTVELIATISKSGDITQVKVVSGDSQLSKAAADAVKQWKYKPYLLNGEPVEIQTQVTIKFKLPN